MAYQADGKIADDAPRICYPGFTGIQQQSFEIAPEALANLCLWKDVVVVPKWGSVTLLVPVTDWPGMTMFHCHIIEHEDIGMMGVWDIKEMPM